MEQVRTRTMVDNNRRCSFSLLHFLGYQFCPTDEEIKSLLLLGRDALTFDFHVKPLLRRDIAAYVRKADDFFSSHPARLVERCFDESSEITDYAAAAAAANDRKEWYFFSWRTAPAVRVGKNERKSNFGSWRQTQTRRDMTRDPSSCHPRFYTANLEFLTKEGVKTEWLLSEYCMEGSNLTVCKLHWTPNALRQHKLQDGRDRFTGQKLDELEEIVSMLYPNEQQQQLRLQKQHHYQQQSASPTMTDNVPQTYPVIDDPCFLFDLSDFMPSEDVNSILQGLESPGHPCIVQSIGDGCNSIFDDLPPLFDDDEMEANIEMTWDF